MRLPLRWIASFCDAAGREEVQAMLDRALKRYTTEQDMIDKVSARPI